LRITRRGFVALVGGATLTALGYLAFGWPWRKTSFECPEGNGISEYRTLGRTGYSVSILTIGGCGPGMATSVDNAVQAFECAISKGINMVDVAPSYGQAEVRLGSLISKYRDRLVVAEKTLQRTRDGAWGELNQSLNRLMIDNFDIYQFHAVGTLEELDQIFGEKGAMKAFLEAKDQGLIKNIGITAHDDMRIVLAALDRFDFDTVMIPINAGSLIHPAPENDFRPVLEVAKDRNMGVMAIKSIAKGRWTTSYRNYQTWYEPLDEQEDIDSALRFTLSQEPVASCPLVCDVSLWSKMISAGERFVELDEDGQSQTVEYLRQKGVRPLFPEDLWQTI